MIFEQGTTRREEANPTYMLGKNVSGRGKNKCKDSGVGCAQRPIKKLVAEKMNLPSLSIIFSSEKCR